MTDIRTAQLPQEKSSISGKLFSAINSAGNACGELVKNMTPAQASNALADNMPTHGVVLHKIRDKRLEELFHNTKNSFIYEMENFLNGVTTEKEYRAVLAAVHLLKVNVVTGMDAPVPETLRKFREIAAEFNKLLHVNSNGTTVITAEIMKDMDAMLHVINTYNNMQRDAMSIKRAKIKNVESYTHTEVPFDNILTLLTKKLGSEKIVCLEVIRAYTEENKPFYAFVIMRKSEAQQLRRRKKSETVKLPNNSVLLCSHAGHDISPDIQEKALNELKKLLKNPK